MDLGALFFIDIGCGSSSGSSSSIVETSNMPIM